MHDRNTSYLVQIVNKTIGCLEHAYQDVTIFAWGFAICRICRFVKQGQESAVCVSPIDVDIFNASDVVVHCIPSGGASDGKVHLDRPRSGGDADELYQIQVKCLTLPSFA